MADGAQLPPCAFRVGVVNEKGKVVRILYSQPLHETTVPVNTEARAMPRSEFCP